MISPVNRKLICNNPEHPENNGKFCDCACCDNETAGCVKDPCRGCVEPVVGCRTESKEAV